MTTSPDRVPIRIVLADDHRMFREALRRVLDEEPDFSVVGEADGGAEAVSLTRRHKPDILLLDLAMPGTDGLAALREITRANVSPQVIMLTGAIDKSDTLTALQLGVRGVVLKESATTLLLKAIRCVRAGEYWVGRESVADLLQAMRNLAGGRRGQGSKEHFGLTARELEVVASVVAACSNKEIAEKFSISEKTVKHHLTNIFNKVGVSNRLELALFALHHNLLPD